MISSQDLQIAITNSISEPAKEVIMRVAIAGQKIMFDKTAHKPLFDEITQNEGGGIAHLMLMLFDKSKSSMPKGALLPAGAIMLAKAFEFTEKAKIKPVDDTAFSNALQEMSVTIADRFDPGFRQKVAEKTGQGIQRETQPQGGIINQNMMASQHPQSGGIINGA